MTMASTKQFVVIVDDDPSMSRAMERLLTAAGLDALAFPSAEALLNSDDAAKAACFIFDIQLGGLSGFDLQRRLSRAGISAPVIFITAFDLPTSRAEAAQLRAFGYFAKPFSGLEFVSAVQRALQAATESEELR